MRYGKGTLINNGGGSSSSSGGGGQHHYEGRFKEDRRHGRGILKVTQNHQRYSTKQKEVKIYEQEWRNGKLVYQKKIHTVIGEEQIANLMLNTRAINYKTHTQILLQMYARNSRGEINFYENIRHYQLDALINYSTPDARAGSSKTRRSPRRSEPSGLASRQGSEHSSSLPSKSQKLKDRGKGNLLYKQELVKKIVGYSGGQAQSSKQASNVQESSQVDSQAQPLTPEEK